MSEGFLTATTSNPSSYTPTSQSLPSNEAKSPTAFRTISEVAESLDLPQHVLRFWESKFQQIKPLKRGGGRRYYRPEDVKVIHDIKDLLHNQGFTIRGVQKLLRETHSSTVARSMVAQPQLPISIQTTAPQPAAEQQIQPVLAPAKPTEMSADKRREMEGVLAELISIRKILEQNGI